jgi:hypothetical protein
VQELQQVDQALSAAGCDYQDLSDDELAKLHLRSIRLPRLAQFNSSNEGSLFDKCLSYNMCRVNNKFM